MNVGIVLLVFSVFVATFTDGAVDYTKLVKWDGARHECSMECTGADRDSVISKTPMWNHKCVRFSTYNMEMNDVTKEWKIWRSGKCIQQNITLEVHCGFPE